MHHTRPPRAAASSSAPDTGHHARTTTHDDEEMLRAQTDTKPETPIDRVRQNWAAAPATGWPPSSSHASVAHTATRPSSQGPASALRFNNYQLANIHITLPHIYININIQSHTHSSRQSNYYSIPPMKLFHLRQIILTFAPREIHIRAKRYPFRKHQGSALSITSHQIMPIPLSHSSSSAHCHKLYPKSPTSRNIQT